MLIENINISLLTLLATFLRLTTTLPSHSTAKLLNGFSLTCEWFYTFFEPILGRLFKGLSINHVSCNVQSLLAQDLSSTLEEGEGSFKQSSQYATYIASSLCSCSVEYGYLFSALLNIVVFV